MFSDHQQTYGLIILFLSPLCTSIHVLLFFPRLTPIYMIIIWLYVGLRPYLSAGPQKPLVFEDENFCSKNIWTNVLYLNNIIYPKEQVNAHFCFAVSVAVSLFFLIFPSVLMMSLCIPCNHTCYMYVTVQHIRTTWSQ